MKYSIFLLLTIIFTGCSQYSNELHPWQSLGNQKSFNLDVTKWKVISKKNIGFIDKKHFPAVIKDLKGIEFLEISLKKANDICPERNFKQINNFKPYIIKGVSYSDSPSVGIIKKNYNLNWIYFYQATYNGEIYIPGVKYTPQARPIVIFLERPPNKIFAIANTGGDWIFRGGQANRTW